MNVEDEAAGSRGVVKEVKRCESEKGLDQAAFRYYILPSAGIVFLLKPSFRALDIYPTPNPSVLGDCHA